MVPPARLTTGSPVRLASERSRKIGNAFPILLHSVRPCGQSQITVYLCRHEKSRALLHKNTKRNGRSRQSADMTFIVLTRFDLHRVEMILAPMYPTLVVFKPSEDNKCHVCT